VPTFARKQPPQSDLGLGRLFAFPAAVVTSYASPSSLRITSGDQRAMTTARRVGGPSSPCGGLPITVPAM
jgi:hypothetical protein